jgi:hypothetical protein
MSDSKGREVRSFDYVNHPYEKVRDVLRADPEGVFSTATRAAASRASSVASELRVEVGGITVGTEIRLTVGDIEETARGAMSGPVTRIPVFWGGAQRPGLFPLMSAELLVYPLTATETQLDFQGRYEPPLGALGGAIDAVVGHRIAEASVDRFVRDVARHLRETIGAS